MSERDGKAGQVILLTVGAAIVGGTACAYIIARGDVFSWAVEDSPLVLAWVTLLAALGAISWAGLFPAITAASQGWKKAGQKSSRFVLGTLGAIVLLVIFCAWRQPQAFPLEDIHWPLGDAQSHRVLGMSIVVLIPPFFAVFGMWLTAAWADENAKAATVTPSVIAQHLELRDRLQSLLWFCGTVVGGAVLATGTLREAVLDAGPTTAEAYPHALVVSYGAFFTFVLVICYVPAYLLMQGAGTRLMNASLAKIEDVSEWKEKRESLSDLLHLKVGLDTSLKDTIAILAPIVAGVLPFAFPE